MILMLLLEFSDPLFTEKSAGTIIGKVDAKDQKCIPNTLMAEDAIGCHLQLTQ
jgi:hypothetical protein